MHVKRRNIRRCHCAASCVRYENSCAIALAAASAVPPSQSDRAPSPFESLLDDSAQHRRPTSAAPTGKQDGRRRRAPKPSIKHGLQRQRQRNDAPGGKTRRQTPSPSRTATTADRQGDQAKHRRLSARMRIPARTDDKRWRQDKSRADAPGSDDDQSAVQAHCNAADAMRRCSCRSVSNPSTPVRSRPTNPTANAADCQPTAR